MKKYYENWTPKQLLIILLSKKMEYKKKYSEIGILINVS